MGDKVEPDKKQFDTPSMKLGLLDLARSQHGRDIGGIDDSNPSLNQPRKISEVLSSSSKSEAEPQVNQDAPSKLNAPPKPNSEIPSKAESQPSSLGQSSDSSARNTRNAAPELLKGPTASRVTEAAKPIEGTESSQRSQDTPLPKTASSQPLLLESLSGQRAKEAETTLVIPPLRTEGYMEPSRSDSVDASSARVKSGDVPAKTSPSTITLGELAARLNQVDQQKSGPPQLSSSSESTSSRTNEKILPSQHGSLNASSDGPKSLANVETTKPILKPLAQSQPNDISAVRPNAQSASTGSEKSQPIISQPASAGQGSSIRDNVHDASSQTSANRQGQISPERSGASYKLANLVEQKSRVDTSLPERASKNEAGKMEATEARTTKGLAPEGHSGGSELIKSNRFETQAIDKTDKPDKTDKADRTAKTDKVDATNLYDGLKNRTEISNQSKREPLIIPGVITSRTSEGGEGSKGNKADGSGKADGKNSDTKNADTTKSDSKKVDGGSAGGKNSGTANDAVSGRKDNIKIDRPNEKGDQRADTKIAASATNVISGVAGRLADGLATIKDKLIPSAKTNADSGSQRVDSHPEFANHSAQPKPNDAALGIERDLKPLQPSANSEFLYNGKKPLSDAREETLSSKTGGLKQALLHIFGKNPDIALDLKANSFPGPKTVPFEKTPVKPGEQQTAKSPSDASQISDRKTSRNIDPGYLRNQKGDKIPTGDLGEELAELKANFGSTKPVDVQETSKTKDAEVDSINRQKIKDFTGQLNQIAVGAESVTASEFFTTNDTNSLAKEITSGEDEYDSRYLYYVKEGDTLRSIFDRQLPHEIANEPVFEYFVKTNEQTVRLASVLAADSMSFVLRPGTVLKLPTPREIAQLKS